MVEESRDAARWSTQLARVDGIRREVLLAAIRHSCDTGWPPSDTAVELLVSYALGEITSRDYATGILESWGVDRAEALDSTPVERSSSPPVAEDVAEDVVSVPAAPPAEPEREPTSTVSRADAVQAYVTGQIPVSEFLRIARS